MPAFSIERRDGIAILTLDVPGAPVNTLSRAVKDEFEELFPRLVNDGAVRAIVLISGKPDNFIAGADIEEFTQIVTADQAERRFHSASGRADDYHVASRHVARSSREVGHANWIRWFTSPLCRANRCRFA